MTIKDIARESGYAVGTVSRVLNHQSGVSDTAREKILAVVEKYHYQINNNAKHLKQQASNGIAVVVKGTQNMLFASIVEQMQGLIRQRGFASLIYYIDESANEVEQAIQICRERRPMGILFLGSNLENFRAGFSPVTVPCVLVTNSAAGLDYDNLSSVSTDDEAAAEAAVEHLLALGHRNIGILGGKTEESGPAAARLSGCLSAFAHHDVPFDLLRQYESARFGLISGYQAMERLLERMPDLTAVFAMSDVMAVGAIRAIQERGLAIPQDISVVGFDGIDLVRYLTPQLTTVRQSRERIARHSVEILLQRIHTPLTAVHEVIPFRLLDGESTARL